MSISSYIKIIGRGKEGARALSAEQAHELFSAVLDKSANDLQIGAFLLAMRIKGETSDELQGFVRSAQERCLPIDLAAADRPAVVLPSYNGARKLPNFTPLLALLLAREGVPVLVHGLRTDPSRVTSAEVFSALDLPLAASAADVQQAWSSGRPAFVPLDVLSPTLSALLDARWTIGLRGPGHTVVKLLTPCVGGRSLRVVSYTHPEYGKGNAEYLLQSGVDALLLRGTEGEPVADPRRQPKLDVFLAGQERSDLSIAPQEGVLATLPELPDGYDAATTAGFIQAVLRGEQAAPAPLLKQLACIVKTLDAMR
jgi:anthranilate phosphoribosyltransferase